MMATLAWWIWCEAISLKEPCGGAKKNSLVFFVYLLVFIELWPESLPESSNLRCCKTRAEISLLVAVTPGTSAIKTRLVKTGFKIGVRPEI